MRPSVIDAIQSIEAVKSNENCRPHIVIGVDAKDDGTPYAGVLLTQGSPTILLGMIESLMQDLKNTRKNILKDMSMYKKENNGDSIPPREVLQKRIADTKDEVKRIIQRLPPEIAEKVKAFQDKMDKAIESNDIAKLEEMRDQMKSAQSVEDILKSHGLTPKKKEEEDDEDFNIQDFKE